MQQHEDDGDDDENDDDDEDDAFMHSGCGMTGVCMHAEAPALRNCDEGSERRPSLYCAGMDNITQVLVMQRRASFDLHHSLLYAMTAL